MPPKKKKEKKEKKKEEEPSGDRELTDNQKIALLMAHITDLERTKNEYKESFQRIAQENLELSKKLATSELERNDLAVYTFEMEEKTKGQIRELQSEVHELKLNQEKARQEITEQAKKEQDRLLEELGEQQLKMQAMQGELNNFKHFEREREFLHKQLDELRETVVEVTEEHQNVIQKMETRFVREKRRAEEETTEQLNWLVRQAHAKAIKNISENTVKAFQENVEMMTAVRNVMEENTKLQEIMDAFKTQTRRLCDEAEGREIVAKESVVKCSRLQDYVSQLEKEKQDLMRNFRERMMGVESEKLHLARKVDDETEVNRAELQRLARALQLKEHEMKKMRGLARDILDQRSELEKFLMNAIEHVKKQIGLARKNAMNETDKAIYSVLISPIRTPGKACELGDLLIAKANKDDQLKLVYKWVKEHKEVQWEDLTWEMKEQVLRYLFIQMNFSYPEKNKQNKSFCRKSTSKELALSEGRVSKSETSISPILPPSTTFLINALYEKQLSTLNKF